MKNKILISQPSPSAGKSPYYDIAEKYGYEIVFRPFFKVESVTTREFRDQKIDLMSFSAVIFTSRVAIDHFFALVSDLRLSMPEDKKYFCISESVAAYLQKYIVYRKRKVFFGTSGFLPELVAQIKKHNKETYFLPVAEEHKNDLSDMLKKAKINFTKGIMYRTVSNDFGPDENIDDFGIFLFFSPSGIVALKSNFPDFIQGDRIFGAFGPATCKAIVEENFRLDIEAPSSEAPSMSAALELFLDKQKK